MVSDGIDGKQARRIGLSGPLGELFDHGLGGRKILILFNLKCFIKIRTQSHLITLQLMLNKREMFYRF